MDSHAQTNAQLFLQLHAAGYPAAELRRVRDAYVFAMQLYTGLFTGSGKTTLAHDVGAASLAHRHGGSYDLIVASLLHSAYVVGDWGHYRARITTKKRAELRAVIGDGAEVYVYHFARQPWDTATIAGLAHRVGTLDQLQRDVIFLHLIDELDRVRELGAVLFFRPATMKESLRRRRDDLCRLAEGLPGPALSAELAEAIDTTLAAELPADLVGLEFPGHANPHVIPRSYRKRLSLRLYRAVGRHAQPVIDRLWRRS